MTGRSVSPPPQLNQWCWGDRQMFSQSGHHITVSQRPGCCLNSKTPWIDIPHFSWDWVWTPWLVKYVTPHLWITNFLNATPLCLMPYFIPRTYFPSLLRWRRWTHSVNSVKLTSTRSNNASVVANVNVMTASNQIPWERWLLIVEIFSNGMSSHMYGNAACYHSAQSKC